MFDPLTGLPILTGVLVGFLASYYGVFVVQRRQSFLGSGLGHAAYGGVGLGIFLGFDAAWAVLPYTVAVALAIVWTGKHTALASDTIIGILFSVSMALGVVFLQLSEGSTADASAYLFGSVLFSNAHDLYPAGLAVFGTLLLIPWWRRWAYATFDPALARSDGHKVNRDDMLLACAVAVVIAVSIKIVGILLIAAFLVLPPAAARLMCRTFAGMTLLSISIGVATALAGLLIAFQTDVPPGPTIVLVQAAVFFGILAVRGAANSA